MSKVHGLIPVVLENTYYIITNGPRQRPVSVADP